MQTIYQFLPKRRGAVALLATFLLVVVLIFTAFATDLGFVMVRKTELQAAVDAAAMAGVMDLRGDQATVEAAVDQYLIHNEFDPNETGITRTIEYGVWDEQAGTFSPGTFGAANAMRLQVVHAALPSLFGRVMGISSYTTSAESTVVLANGPPRDIVLVLDVSGSMNASMSNGFSRIENTITATNSMVANLSDEDRLGLVVYSWSDTLRNDMQKTGKLETQMDFDHTQALNVVNTLTAGHYTSGTNIGGGYRAALDVFLNDPSPRDATEPELVKVVVILTDGQVNMAEPYPSPDDGPTGTLPPGPYNKNDYVDWIAMQQWANTLKARGIKVYAIKLHGTADSDFSDTASLPDSYDGTYFFHIAHGSEDTSNLLDTYRKIGVGQSGPKIVR
ncbi:MAG: VWA domain-containing protein [Planctomycetaceae bacterium]